MRKGGKAYFAANVATQGFALLRYVILARLLGPEQLGVAAMLILTATFFESISDTGSDRFLVQDSEGDTPKMQGLVQLVMAARGALIALALALSAGLFAQLYNMPQVTWSLVALGLAPLIGGFVHLDLRRVQREADFRPESLALIVSETAMLIATAAAAAILRDHTAVIYGLVVRAICLVGVSHWTAKRPYRWAFDRDYGKKFGVFALPLAANGLLLFFGSQGDRLIVGSTLTATALGHYSAVTLLVYYPTSMVGRYLSGIHLPSVANSREQPEAFRAARWRVASQFLLLGAAVVAGFTLLGPVFTPLFYGASFQQPLQIFALLALLQATRFVRLWPTALAVGTGRSTIVMLNNIARMIGLPIAIVAAQISPSLEAIILGIAFGELVALVVALSLLAREGTVDLLQEFRRVGLFLAFGAGAVGVAWSAGVEPAWFVALCALVGVAAGGGLLYAERATLTTTLQIARRRLERIGRRKSA